MTQIYEDGADCLVPVTLRQRGLHGLLARDTHPRQRKQRQAVAGSLGKDIYD